MDKQSAEKTINALSQFIDRSPTPFHACKNVLAELLAHGYQALNEADSWDTSLTRSSNGRFVVTRNDSSLIAFDLGKNFNFQRRQEMLAKQGFRLIGAHTDSPCLKIKPNADSYQHACHQLNVEVYGGALLNPWFDRDLSIAGRVSCLNLHGKVEHFLVDFVTPLAVLPSLAIHLDKEANSKRSIDKQLHLSPIFLTGEKQPRAFLQRLQQQLEESGHQVDKILAFELSLYDVQGASQIGFDGDLFCASRLDNLLSCQLAASALIESNNCLPSMIVLNDHEEVGSVSTSGAQGNFLLSVLQRLTKDQESFQRCIRRSILISADNAHAIHPNYAHVHDAQQAPKINQGPVIKVNVNQRYASNSNSSAILQRIAKQADIPLQYFSSNNNQPCGSTIGPLTAATTGIETVDLGIASFAMHSIRETVGCLDILHTKDLFKAYFSAQELSR